MWRTIVNASHIRAALVEGNSIRATVRMTGVAKNTVTKLLVDLGAACARYQDETLRNLPCRRLQWDEIWSFVGTKDKNVPAEKRYSPAHGIGTTTEVVTGDPDSKHISTSYVERQNSRCG